MGWALDFGANTFLPGFAIARSFREIASIFTELASGNVVFREQAIARIMRQISGCVATHDGYEYNGYYPMDGDYMTFGTQLIDAELGAKLVLHWADPKGTLLSRQ